MFIAPRFKIKSLAPPGVYNTPAGAFHLDDSYYKHGEPAER